MADADDNEKLDGGELTPLDEDVEVEEEENYEVEKIIQKRTRQGETEYLVKWKGWGNEDNTWVPASGMGADELITSFEAEVSKPRKRGRPPKQRTEEEEEQGRKRKAGGKPSGRGGRGAPAEAKPVRFGQVIRVREGCEERYQELCKTFVQPAISECFKNCNIQNFTIFHKAGLLFCFFEYMGDDIATDFTHLADDAAMKQFWDTSKEYQEPMDFREPHEWWSRMEEMFHSGEN